MKTYKTWEVIKELTENRGKEFETTGFHGNKLIALNAKQTKYGDNDQGYLISTKDVDGDINEFPLNRFMLSREWKEVKKSVNFITAIESGKKIRVEHYFLSAPHEKHQLSNHYRYLTEIFEQFGRVWNANDVRKIILEGKWYIED